MKLKISGYNEAKRIIESGWPTKVISIVDTKLSRLVEDNENNVTGIFFDTLQSPKKENVFPLFDFFKQINNEDRVLIHCSAGISRSTATALSLLLYKGFEYESALQILYKARPAACPNDTIIDLFDEYHSLNGELSKKYKVTKGKFITDFNNYSESTTNPEDMKMGFSDLLKQYSEIEGEPTDEDYMNFDNQIDKDAEDILAMIRNGK